MSDSRPTATPVRVTEAFVSYRPAVDCARLTQRLLSTVPHKYLVELDSVVLCSLSEQSRSVRIGTLPRRGRRIKRDRVAGLYHHASRGQKAWIQIFVDNIQFPPWYLSWIGPTSEMAFGSVLYHELGHHVHTIRPEYREKEDVADQWSDRFLLNHLKKKYLFWYSALWCAAKLGRLLFTSKLKSRIGRLTTVTPGGR